MKIVSIPKLSSSLILIKEGMEILFIKRQSNQSFANMYAFPGGICDETDHGIPGYDPFKITALRETFEEVGILVGNSKHPMTDFSQSELPPQELLQPMLRLITIPTLPKRYDTRYFIAFNFQNGRSQSSQDFLNLVINKSECVSYEWMTSRKALNSYYNKTIELAPPQQIILNILSGFENQYDLQKYLSSIQIKHLFAPYQICFRKNPDQSSDYPFIAYNTFDEFYPVSDIIKQETDEQLNKEFSSLEIPAKGWENKFYFSDPKQLFSSKFQPCVKLPFLSPFQRMVDYQNLMERVKVQIR